MRIRCIAVLFAAMLCFSMQLQAQKSLVYTHTDKEFILGMELFEKQKYAAAQQCFNRVIEQQNNARSLVKSDAQYYAALCAIELFNDDAEYLVLRFINENKESRLIQSAYFQMGRYCYNRKKFNDAIDWFAKVDKAGLSPDEFSEYCFESGYAYFMRNDNEKARFYFSEIKDIDTKYTSPALYYYSHIAYAQKNYETALSGFDRLKDDETFSPIVPYYITQIYYLKNDYDKVIEYAVPVFDSVNENRKAEVARIIGDSYFKKEKYAEAIPYFEKYAIKDEYLTPADKYEMAYAYYKTAKYAEASRLFERVSASEDTLGQNAMYLLGDCYVKLNDKNKARMAFASAAKLDFDKNMKEDALFNYSLVTYELSFAPFNEAINAFNQYLKEYPNSKRSDEAYKYLVQAYLSTRNYKDALVLLNKIKSPDASTKKAYQRVAFFRGLELYNNLLFEDASKMLDRSLKYAEFDASMAAQAWYWKGEAAYRLEKYDEAIEYYTNFLSGNGAISLNEYAICHYNLGYCYFSKKDFAQANIWFKKYVALMGNAKTKLMGDAYNRIGDCYFMVPTYWEAIGFYEKAIDIKLADADYAMFQKGFALGLVNRPQKKIDILNQLLTEYPASVYYDDALYELGRSYEITEQNDKAIVCYNKILDKYSSSSYVKKALVQLGLVYSNTNKDDDAITAFKRAATEYPGTEESKNALKGMKNIYVERNEVDKFLEFVKSLGGAENISETEQDSLMYTAAEKVYMTGDCDKSTESLKRYIENYPNGNFVLNAHFYKADCNYRKEQWDEALISFNYIIAKPRNMFTEQALLGACRINFHNGNYAAAVENYTLLENVAELQSNILEARIGKLRSCYLLNDYVHTIEAANRLLITEKLPEEMVREAHFKTGRSWQLLGKNDSALIEYRRVAVEVKSAEGAEAKYRVAEILFTQKKTDKAEKEITNFISQTTPQQYWMAKSFILLADIYFQKGDEFQATQTLQSIIDNYENQADGIQAEAKQKLLDIKNKNKKKSEKTEDDIEINLNE